MRTHPRDSGYPVQPDQSAKTSHLFEVVCFFFFLKSQLIFFFFVLLYNILLFYIVMPLKMTDLGEEFLLQEDALNIFWDNEILCQGYAGDTDEDGSFCDVPPAPTLQQRK